MFRLLLMISSLLGGLMLAQLTKDTEVDAEAASRETTEPDPGAEGSPSDATAPGAPADANEAAETREPVAVMAEPTEPARGDEEATLVLGEIAPDVSADAEVDESLAAAVGEPLAEVEGIGEEVGITRASWRPGRRARAIAIAGVAAIAGLAVGYLAIRRTRPDLLAAIRPTLPAAITRATVLAAVPRTVARPESMPEVPARVLDLAEAGRSRLAGLRARSADAGRPALRSTAASVAASVLASAIASRIVARR